jgi:hypothetical protein
MQDSVVPESTTIALQHLKTIRPVLLNLHKALLDAERTHYEQQHGSIASSGEFLRLVLGDEWFSWLRPISQFIVQIDEVIWSKDPLQWNKAELLITEAKQIFSQATVQDNLPFKRYGLMLEQSHDVATLHQTLHSLLGELETSA